MPDAGILRDLASVLAIVAGVLIGALSVCSSCYVWIKEAKFGLGGSALAGVGLVLIGLSIFSRVEFTAGPATIKAEMFGTTQKVEPIPLPACRPGPVELSDAEKDAMNRPGFAGGHFV